MGERNSSPSISARMIAPPEKAFFTTYGPSYDGFSKKGSPFTLSFAKSRFLDYFSPRPLRLSIQHDLRLFLVSWKLSLSKLFIYEVLSISGIPSSNIVAGMITLFQIMSKCPHFTRHKAGRNMEFRNGMFSQTHLPLGKIVDGYQYELMPVRRLWGRVRWHGLPLVPRASPGSTISFFSVYTSQESGIMSSLVQNLSAHCQPIQSSDVLLLIFGRSRDGYSSVLDEALDIVIPRLIVYLCFDVHAFFYAHTMYRDVSLVWDPDFLLILPFPWDSCAHEALDIVIPRRLSLLSTFMHSLRRQYAGDVSSLIEAHHPLPTPA
uniref:Uncharacterized protein n=1 Tax=Fagus sylvatica TaxID=28930 RepID=A0A2N9IMB9_FAGSY